MPLARFADVAKATLSLGVVMQGLVQRLGIKIRPQAIGEMKFSVRALPEQEIGQAHLSTSANEQVRIGHVGRGHEA